MTALFEINSFGFSTISTGILLSNLITPYLSGSFTEIVKILAPFLKLTTSEETILSEIKILSHKIKAHELAFMTHQELMPEKWNHLIEELLHHY